MFQITFKTPDGQKFPNRKICFIRYIHDNDNNIYGIVSHYMDKKTGKCPGRGYESYFISIEEEAKNRDQYFLLDKQILDLVERIEDQKKVSDLVIDASKDNNDSSTNQVLSNSDIMKNVKNMFGGKKTKRKTRNKKYKYTKSNQNNLTNKRK